MPLTYWSHLDQSVVTSPFVFGSSGWFACLLFGSSLNPLLEYVFHVVSPCLDRITCAFLVSTTCSPAASKVLLVLATLSAGHMDQVLAEVGAGYGWKG